jgi:RnfABCDGE-type electron transport complex B subunit
MIVASIFVLGVLGFIFAALLGLAADYFKVEEDPRVSKLLGILPGTNCGACGSAGCHDFAVKLIRSEVAVTGCVAGGPDVASNLAAALGLDQPAGRERKTAAVHCGAREDQRKKKARYSGVKTCQAADLIDGGGLLCRYGCLGYGDCFEVCPFNAIKMVDGLPVLDPGKCTACGKCLTACPRNIISLIPCGFKVVVACSSHDRSAETRKICPVGCFACKICEKEVSEVFKVTDNLALMDYTRSGVDCQTAIEKCPAKCIVKA